MISFPHAKINLGLKVLRRLPNGFHEIETGLYPVELSDVLEINESSSFSFEQSGLEITGEVDQNLVVKAYHLLSQNHKLPPVSIHLHKVIPMGAGLGGGSSDGAFALKMLNEIFNLGLNKWHLQVLSAQLGSDCPFFINSDPCIATGKGTDLSPIELDLSRYRIELTHPEVHISTKEAYSHVEPDATGQSVKEILGLPISEWKNRLVNGFEKPIVEKFSKIKEVKDQFYKQGALYASMTGSGSSVFALFKK